jgi:hypothetical protein
MSNLLSKASILLTPTAYSDGTLHSVKPIQTFGSELVTNGDFATDSNWSVNAGWSISDGKANIDTDNGTLNLTQSGVLVVGKKYKLSLIANVTVGSIKFESGEGDNLVFTSNIDSHIFTADSTQVIFRRQVVPTRGYIDNVSIVEVTDGDFDFTRATTATRVNSSGLIESVASGLPRIDFTGGTGQILLEPASTNLITYSEDLAVGSGGTSSQNNAATTPSSLPSPDGGTNAFTFIYDGTNNSSIKKPTTISADQVVTLSVFIKKTADTPTFSADNEIQIGIFGNVVSTVSLNLGNALNAATTGEWVKYSVTATGDSDGGSTNPNLRCDVAAQVDVFGWQLETSSFATSYIPTSGSTVTRNKEEANNSGDTSLISSTEGVLYAEIAAFADDNIPRNIALSSGNRTNTVEIFYGTSTNQISFKIRANNSNVTVQNRTVSDRTQLAKVAIKYKSGDIEFFINGVKEVDRTDSFTFSSSLSELAFDRGDGSDEFEGKVKCVAVFKEALTDAQLISLTS